MSERHHRRIAPLNRGQLKALFRGLEFDRAAPANRADPALDPVARGFVDRWMAVAAGSDPGLARLFAERVGGALRLMDLAGVEAWLLSALEQFDRRGLGWAIRVLNDAESFAAERRRGEQRLALTAVAPLLGRLTQGWGGRELKIEAGELVYTDSETLFLPAHVATGRHYADNLSRYKALAVHHWAQLRYGTWRPQLLGKLCALDTPALERYAAAERLRLAACIGRDLPGAFRDLCRLDPLTDDPGRLAPGWRAAHAALTAPAADPEDSLSWAARLADIVPPPRACFHGRLLPAKVQAVTTARLQRDRARLQLTLRELREQLRQRQEPDQGGRRQPRRRKPDEGFSLSQHGQPGSSSLRLQLYFDRRPLALSAELEQLLSSVLQDLGEVPEEYFQPGGDKPYNPQAGGRDATAVPLAAAEFRTADGFSYPEWDYARQRYRIDYCRVLEHPVTPGELGTISATLHKYRALVTAVRRAFEALQAAPRLERRQPDGDDIDIDALVTARAEARRGGELSESVYIRQRHSERSIAVLIAVDMSGSTKGWVCQAEREALVLLCAALEAVGDEYAIYGFSGRTHRRVETFRVKTFGEPYSDVVQARIAGIRPHAYTRMGAALRHFCHLLQQVPVRHKLLLVLSDGKPEDYGSYYGRYGVEDTRHALLELHHLGVQPFCITLDREGADYLPTLYGTANYVVIDDVRRLPLKVADIYRRLTT